MLVIYFLLAALSVIFISKYVYNLFRRNKGNHAFIVLKWFEQFIYSNDCFLYGFIFPVVKFFRMMPESTLQISCIY